MSYILLLVTFLESFATICVERGVYFYSFQRLGFSEGMNLWLALALGVAYVIGAASSHALSKRLCERTVLLGTIAAQAIMNVGLAMLPVTLPVFAFVTMLGFFNGAKWPVIESYISAGKNPRQQAASVGRFNVAWALAVPLSLLFVGPFYSSPHLAPLMFYVPAAINIVCLLLCRPLPSRPVHLAADHAERPDTAQIARLQRLLTSSRWLMLGSYSMMFLLAPLLPVILKGLQVGDAISPGLSSLLDMLRLAAFVVLGAWTGWHGRVSPVIAGMIGVPLGFFMVLFGPTLPIVLAGEVLFGFSAGMVYFAALYYAMVVQNASVAGGGTHESLIGLGFAIGPAAGLLGVALLPYMGGSKVLAEVVSVGPVLLLCTLAACLPLLNRKVIGRRQ